MPGSRPCSVSAAASARSDSHESCAASASGVSAASQSGRCVPRRISASAARPFSTAPSSSASALARGARLRQLLPCVAQQQLHLAAAETRAEELRREIRNLVGLVDDHRVRGAQQVAEAFFLERQVREQQVVVHDDDVGLDGLAARLDHVAAADVGATAPRQLSRVEVICGHSGCASPRSATSARSPLRVLPAQRCTRASMRSRVPGRLRCPPSCFRR